jgi:hypothetical protein
MKKIAKRGGCCITIGLQFPPDVPTAQVGYTISIGQNVLMGPYLGQSSLDEELHRVSPALTGEQRIDMARAIQEILT